MSQPRTEAHREDLPDLSRGDASAPEGLEPRILNRLPGGGTIVAGNAGDHRLIVNLLNQVYHLASAENFQSRVDEPSYAPSDRLLLKRDANIVGHVQVARHIGWFQGHRLPLAHLQDFVLLPEYCSAKVQSAEYDAELLKTAETVAANEGAVLGLLHTDEPQWFEQQGWSRCQGQGHTRANTLAILSHFDAQWALPKPFLRSMRPTIEVRTWRHFELDCLQHLYERMVPDMWGPLYRSKEHWQWLVGRKTHDQILIAVEHPPGTAEEEPFLFNDPDDDDYGDNGTDLETEGPEADEEESLVDLCDPQTTVGYAVVRDSCIVEMFTLPGHEQARSLLVARACRDAIDRDHHFVSVHTPSADPMHELLITAGGNWIHDSSSTCGQWMMKLLSPEKWVEKLYPLLHQRARASEVARPLEIGFDVDGQAFRLTLTRRSSHLQQGKLPEEHIACSWHWLQNLLTSNLTHADLASQIRRQPGQRDDIRKLAQLFPPQLFWQSPFELLWLS